MLKDIFSRIARLIVALSVAVSVLLSGNYKAPEHGASPSLKAPSWPAWVHEHWVWENAGTQHSAMQLVTEYRGHDIPVGAVIIDRPWATDSNTFIPDPERYPDLGDYVENFHNIDVRVLLWATSIINEEASNFQEAKDNGYFLSGGKSVKWWGGKGALIDYTNPDAVKWWHGQMDKVLDMGIDGWKVDGTDPYVMLLLRAKGYSDSYVTWNEYRTQCYSDFYEYTRQRLGNDRVISARPVDDQLSKLGLPLNYSNRDVNFAGWVGDNDNDWSGLRHALNNMFASAEYNYVSYGSDIGGFRSDDKIYKDVFVRWAQLGAFCPIMENGGGGEHRPWMIDDETLSIYRKYSVLHTELIPYIYSQAAYSYELNLPTMRPQLGEYTYLLGDDILVAPFFKEGTERTVVFPEGEWIYMFDESKIYQKGIQKLSFALDEFPVFIRKGAIIPMNIDSSLTGFGSELSADYMTVLLYPDEGEKEFGLYEENKSGTVLSYEKASDVLTITCTPTDRALLYRLNGEPAPENIVLTSGANLPRVASMAELKSLDSGYYTDNGTTFIAVMNNLEGTSIEISY